ncbi:uncharacterized protein LOC6561439 [Drosophila grimshawi]|uniref:uncharacterized protein LOC6561439 n=1 Tax=Drosophila grimshawi TaxID=7222 RepID=UPI000C870E20|nr:uncharacterized protein LOC6561439 [Drosophila grimshawi]
MQQQQQQRQQQQQQQQSSDHIITISTASLTDNSQDEPIKCYTKTTTTATQAAIQEGVEAGTGTGAGLSPGTTPVAAKKSRRFQCSFSQLISYQNNIADVQHRRGRRLHGLQLPLHPLQLFGWLVLVLFGIASYWLLIPAFHAPIQGPLYGLISGLYVVHIVAHLTALLTDPADKELRRVHRNDRIVPEFDRSKHGHVIENGRCHLCNIRTTTPRTKHCSVCNKCVGKFDHHCKWLNHCIGSRNYVAFLMCVVSAVVATLVIVAAVIGQIVLYYVQPDWLSFYWCQHGSSELDGAFGSTDYINLTLSLSNGSMLLLEEESELAGQLEQDQRNLQLNLTTLPTLLDNFTALLVESSTNEANTTTSSTTTTTTVPLTNHTLTPLVAGIGLHETIYLLLLGVLGLLAAISAGLLLHLCFFHIYISFLGLTTYEYIRNHRQAQEAKAKQLLELGHKTNGVHFNTQMPTPTNHPSKIAGGAQLYCCSSVPHPNQRMELSSPGLAAAAAARRSHRLHCCASSREFHQSRQALYMCSLLQERNRSDRLQLELETGERENEAAMRSFHCCSSYAASSVQRRSSTAASAQVNLEPRQRRFAAAGSSAYLQYTEQCTLCTFQLRSPLRSSSAAGSSSTRTLASQTATTMTPASSSSSASASKQRWRRKWNCCASVPDSPDVPQDLLAALAYREQGKLNANELPVQFIRSLNGGLELPHVAGAELPLKTPRSSRLRHMLRLLGRYRRPRCQRGHLPEPQMIIKQNQIRPLQLQPGRGYDNPAGTSSTGTTPTPPLPASCSSPSSGSSDLSNEHLGKEVMLLPTSVIRDDSVTTSYSLTLPPALPPPTRRKMPNASELAELAETLGFISSQTQTSTTSAGSRHLPGLGNVYRRQRRKHFLRTRSPTLSPIHESGLSNPTSPQPLRHGLAVSTSSVASSSNSNNAKCSPDVARSSSASLVQNLCGIAGDALRKTASNSSLQSISSNSSST